MNTKEIAQKYKRQTASRYLPIEGDQITTKIMEAEMYAVSTKFDGHLYLLSFDGKNTVLINHGGTTLTDLPLLKDATKLLKGKCNDILLAGELYLSKDGERTRSFDMTAVLDEKSENIHFAVFDLLMLDGQEVSMDIKELDKKLTSVLSGGKMVYPVNNSFVESRKDIAAQYKEIVEEGGHEGIVVRSLNGPTYKVKPLITLDAVILGYAEGDGSRAGMLKEFLVGLCITKDQYLLLTKVGNGYSDDERKKLLKPNIFKRFGRKVVIFFNVVKDALLEVAGSVMTKSKLSEGNKEKIMGTFKDNSLNNYSGENHQPIWENYIGKHVILEQIIDDKKQEYVGVLKEYSANYILLFDVDYITENKTKKADIIFPRTSAIIRHAVK